MSTLNSVLGGPSDLLDKARPQAATRNPAAHARTIVVSGSGRRTVRSRRNPSTAYHDAKKRSSLSTFGETVPPFSTPRLPWTTPSVPNVAATAPIPANASRSPLRRRIFRLQSSNSFGVRQGS